MAEKHELAQRDYILGMTYKGIADKYGVSENTVKSWKKRHGWSRDKTAQKTVKVGAPIAPLKKQKGCTPKNRGEPDQEEEQLSDQEQLFCYHYVRTWNATQAALKAGYGNGNKGSAAVLGCRLMQRERIKAGVESLKVLFRQEIHVDIQDFLGFCMKVVGADIGDYLQFGAVERIVYDDGVPLKDDKGQIVKESYSMIALGESDQLDTSVITEVKQGRDGISIKLADKKWAWEQLSKYFDWLPDKWQRAVEDRKVDLEERRVALAEKAADDSGGGEDAPTFVDDIGDDNGKD